MEYISQKIPLKKITRMNVLQARLINGREADLIRLRLRGFIFRQVLSVNRDPWGTIAEVRRIRQRRAAVHGNQKIRKFVKSGGYYYWATDFPGLPSENLKKAIKDEFRRNHLVNGNDHWTIIPQQTIIWGITNRCMLKCRHCYDWDNIDSKDHLKYEELKLILERIKTQGIRHVQLSGGEPLLRFDDMVSLIRGSSGIIDFWLLTSGFGLTAEKAERLKNAGLKGVNISLDHWDERKHNEFRNHPGSFKWVLHATSHCREAGLIVSLSLCATREFVSEENLLHYAKLARELGAHFIRILEPREAGHFAGQKVFLDRRKTDMISRFAIRMNTAPEYADYPIVTFFGYHQRKLGCMGAANRYMYIDANGDFHACPFCRGRKGNALHEPFNDIIHSLRKTGCHVFKTLDREL